MGPMLAGPEARVPSYWECFSTFCQQTILHGWHYLTPATAQAQDRQDLQGVVRTFCLCFTSDGMICVQAGTAPAAAPAPPPPPDRPSWTTPSPTCQETNTNTRAISKQIGY